MTVRSIQVRIILAAIVMASLFVFEHPAIAAGLGLITLIATLSVRADLRPLRLLALPLAMTAVIIIGLQVTVGTGNDNLTALTVAAIFVIRAFTIITLMAFVTAGAPTLTLARAIGGLLSPLGLFRVPVDELALALAMATAFIPMLAAEDRRVVQALAARGATATTGLASIRSGLWRVRIHALVFRSFLFARTTADMLHVRGYGIADRPTHLP